MGEFVCLEVDEASRVGTIRLDRPPVNALNAQLAQSAEGLKRLRPAPEALSVLERCADILAGGAETRRAASWVVGREGRELLERLCERMICRILSTRGTSLGYGTPDNGGYERIAAATSILGLTSANAQDQQR